MTIGPETLATAFERTAASFERGRPGYPREIFATVADDVGLRPGARVLDLAAGTGKLTRLLCELGTDVVAVEPLASMREQLARSLPEIELLDGRAEAIPLPDDSVDVVTVGQAFHWFDAAAALTEIARVLRPGGGFVTLWNEAYQRDPLTKRLFDAVRSVGNRLDTIEVDWRVVIDESNLFQPSRRGRWRWIDEVTHGDLLAAVESRSYVSVLEPARRAEFLGEIATLLQEYPEPFPLPYVTEVYWCRRLPNGSS